MDPITAVTFRDVITVLFKFKWSILTILIVSVLGTAFWLYFIRADSYSTVAKVLVKLGQEEGPPATVNTPLPVITYRSEEVQSEMDIMQSAELIAQVVDQLHLDRPLPEEVPQAFFKRVRYHIHHVIRLVNDWLDDLLIRMGLRERLSPREKAIYALMEGLKVDGSKDSNVFVAQLDLPIREHSAVVLNTLLDDYMIFRLELFQNDKTAAFFHDRLGETTRKLSDVENQRQEYESRYHIAQIAEQQELLLARVNEAIKALHESQIALDDASSKVSRLDQLGSDLDPNLGSIGEFDKDSLPQSLLKEYGELRRQMEQLRLTELDSSDRVQNVREQLKLVASMLGANVRSTLAERTRDYQTRKSFVDSLQAEIDSLHERQMHWEDLSRKGKDLEDSYFFYSKKFEETSASSLALEQRQLGSVVIIEHAMDPILPTGMRKPTLLGISAIVGIFAALAWIAIAEFFDHRIYKPEELQRCLEAPVLATIPIQAVNLSDVVANARDTGGFGTRRATTLGAHA